MKMTTANARPSALEVMSTPTLMRDLLPPTHPDGQHRMREVVLGRTAPGQLPLALTNVGYPEMMGNLGFGGLLR